MQIYLRRMVEEDGEESYDVLFDTFAAFLATLDRHFGDHDEQPTTAIVLNKLQQTNRKFEHQQNRIPPKIGRAHV